MAVLLKKPQLQRPVLRSRTGAAKIQTKLHFLVDYLDCGGCKAIQSDSASKAFLVFVNKMD